MVLTIVKMVKPETKTPKFLGVFDQTAKTMLTVRASVVNNNRHIKKL